MKKNKPQISIIIPVLNEEDYIRKVLVAIRENATSTNIKEVLVIDGGSADHTVKEALGLGVQVVSAAKGRAKQMNKGAQIATGDLLYFLHVDTIPPKGFDAHILNTFSKGFESGCIGIINNSKFQLVSATRSRCTNICSASILSTFFRISA